MFGNSLDQIQKDPYDADRSVPLNFVRTLQTLWCRVRASEIGNGGDMLRAEAAASADDLHTLFDPALREISSTSFPEKSDILGQEQRQIGVRCIVGWFPMQRHKRKATPGPWPAAANNEPAVGPPKPEPITTAL